MNTLQQVLAVALLGCMSTMSFAYPEDLEHALEEELKSLLITEQKPYVAKADPELEKKTKSTAK